MTPMSSADSRWEIPSEILATPTAPPPIRAWAVRMEPIIPVVERRHFRPPIGYRMLADVDLGHTFRSAGSVLRGSPCTACLSRLRGMDFPARSAPPGINCDVAFGEFSESKNIPCLPMRFCLLAGSLVGCV